MTKNTYKTVDLFGNEQTHLIERDARKANLFTQYDEFVEKFEVKKTTDDCYTPTDVFKIVLDYVGKFTDLSNKTIIRPFYPNGDYEAIQYGNNDIVIDNPPFSIISKIVKFYLKNNIKFFLFAPHLTLFGSDLNCTHIVSGADIIYENGAKVKTSFLSNIVGDFKIMTSTEIYKAVEKLNNSKKANLPVYKYPSNVLTVSHLSWMVERGIDLSFANDSCRHVRALDDQKKHKKAIFGSGFLISEKAAAEKAAAEKAAAEKAAAEKAAAEKAAAEKAAAESDEVIYWKLSKKEIEIIKTLL